MKLLFHLIGLICVFLVTYLLLGLILAIIITLVFAALLERRYS